jgi:hypothetical protein
VGDFVVDHSGALAVMPNLHSTIRLNL